MTIHLTQADAEKIVEALARSRNRLRTYSGNTFTLARIELAITILEAAMQADAATGADDKAPQLKPIQGRR